ncbi:hypothetical protein [Chondromyces apiculatus]|uniref:Dihydrolipoamide acetyltransferase component of pyruvate dehydrogenase complex n=1 Tax=Chondromyces apiculatus DSM 436 TaxID=1192034 RepID=A0A017TIZ4_9BACT|nr:hypothetical protein [Chondromyces apiculatus]EYF08820.1 Dihydrolipoamide acetyltransferase component of pyruvate dehydrogenase complex [Chondromyces apiculatus DSM 436]
MRPFLLALRPLAPLAPLRSLLALRPVLALVTALPLAACAASPVVAPQTPVEGAPAQAGPVVQPPPPQGDVFAVSGPLKEETLSIFEEPTFDARTAAVPPAPIGLPAPPPTCDAFVKRAPVKEPACADRPAGLAALDAALAEADPAQRDARLAGLEACAGIEPGLVRALRADLAPTACADAIDASVLAKPPAGLRGDMHQVLLGQTLAARLARTAQQPPKMAPPYDKERVLAFTKGPLLAWLTDQARAIEDLGRLGVELRLYARGLVAVEAGMADLRLVEAVRAAPLPDGMAKDEEARNVYYGTLDQLLDPWKSRGRDAALVGLREMAMVGILHDARVDASRAMLSRLYGGRRIDALDTLMVPPLPAASPASTEERLAATLPTFYAGRLLPAEAVTRPGTLRALLARGVPMQQRAALHELGLTPEGRALYARARLDLGRLYWRAVDFDQATALLKVWPKDTERPADVTFTLALALALRNGPEDAALMMRRAPLTALGLGEVTALDWVARSKPASPFAGAAAFNAALVKQMSAPQDAGAAVFREIAARFHEAASLLSGAEAKDAEDRARAAEETAKAIQ